MERFNELKKLLEKAEKERKVIKKRVDKKTKGMNEKIMSAETSEEKAMELIEKETKIELDEGLISIDIKIHDLEEELREEFFKKINELNIDKEKLNLINSLKKVKHYNAHSKIIELAKKWDLAV
ncbi:MAG: hypothetical protein ACLFPJ_06395 [Candidatus Woesearchaeota archaeon]